MAIGDVVSDIQSIAAGAFLAIQPPSGQEWCIHNILHESDAELHFYNGTYSLLADSDPGAGGWMGYFFHCTNSKYYRVKNTTTSARLISYDGVVTKG